MKPIHKARKRFGQNFLVDQGIIQDIIRSIYPQKHQRLVEIGPGLAALTEPMAEQLEHLDVIEIDRDLVARLRTHPFLSSKLTVHNVDALQFDFKQLLSQSDRSSDPSHKLRVFGNLPYNISTPLIFHLLSQLDSIEDMHFMLQQEVVDRMASEPHQKSYGRLSVMIQYSTQVVPLLTVPPEAFEPRPKVDSAVVRLTPYQTIPYPAHDLAMLDLVTKTAFSQRRKTLRNNLKELITAEALERLDIDPTLRPENLTVEQFVRIANALSE